MKFSRLLVSGFMLTGLLQAQSEKDLIREVQRDVAQLQNQIRQSKDAQDQKNAELEALLKQTLDANSKLVASLGALQQTLTSAVAAQQDKLVQPINAMSGRVDQMSQAFGTLQTSMDEMTRRLARNDEKLTEVLNNVKTLNAPPAAPPPSAAGPGAGTTPGASADVAFQAAERDYRSAQNQLAMDEFRAFIAQFPSAENAPKAQYYMGVIYDRGQQYEDAVKAYDAVLERYPENPATRDALYGKAVALMKLDRNVEAKKEFSAFVQKYPADDKVAQARQYLKDLSGPARPPLNNGKRRTK
jgi:TolA-binding protein